MHESPDNGKTTKHSAGFINRKLVNAVMIFFVAAMITIILAAIINVFLNPINSIVKDLSEPNDITAASIAAIESAANNAIASTTLIVTVLGAFVTGLSIFAAIIVVVTKSKLDDTDKKLDAIRQQSEATDEKMKNAERFISDVKNMVNSEICMRHISTGIRNLDCKRYAFAADEFHFALESENTECKKLANYYSGRIYSELYSENRNTSYFLRAKECWDIAIKMAVNNDLIITSDLYGSLGGLFGLRAEFDFTNEEKSCFLDESENYLKKALEVYNLSLYEKNLAITYALRGNINESKNHFWTGIYLEFKELGIEQLEKRKKSARSFINNSFSDDEKHLLEETVKIIVDDIYKSIDIMFSELPSSNYVAEDSLNL